MPHSSVLSGRGGGPPRRLTALNDGGEGQDSVQMIDLTIVRAHQHAAGAQKKRALRAKALAAREVAFRPRFI